MSNCAMDVDIDSAVFHSAAAWGDARELSVEELSSVAGGSVWGSIKHAAGNVGHAAGNVGHAAGNVGHAVGNVYRAVKPPIEFASAVLGGLVAIRQLRE